MRKIAVKFLPPLIFLVLILIFFYPVILQNKIPVPADTIVGMYHPWRDYYSDQYPSGIPFKNFLITDPVRQQYPWRKLAIDLIKKGNIPIWNPFNLSGTPLLASMQSAPFYPLNIIFFILPFDLTWSFLVFLQPLFGGLFLYLYLRQLNLKKEASFLGGFVFAFCGFFVAWLEWNTIIHTALWLPLILLSIEKILRGIKKRSNSKLITSTFAKASVGKQNFRQQRGSPRTVKLQLKTENFIFWSIIFIFTLTFSFFAGHLQTFFYVFLLSLVYLIVRIILNLELTVKKKLKIFFLFSFFYSMFFIISLVQWLPALRFIGLSAREFDQAIWQKPGWFIPWQNLIQFFAPDFFGNPATLNYWGVWNYGEFIGYIGIFPLLMAFFAMFWRKDKKTLFFGSVFFFSLIFALPTPLAMIPYQLRLPFLSTASPTRFLFLTDFSLAVLAALGFDLWLRQNKRLMVNWLLIYFTVIFGLLWAFVIFGAHWLNSEVWIKNLSIAKRNLILPTALFIAIFLLLLTIEFLTSRKKFQRVKTLLIYFILLLTIFDLFRFGWKFTPFSKKEYLFPTTEAIDFLQKQPGIFRIMTVNSRILPPNFSIVYKLQTIEGYDPLYLLRYGELLTAVKRGKPDISAPFGFNRILTLDNYDSKIIDLLNVKYILSLKDEVSPKLVKVFQEGETRIYENKAVFPRVFMVYAYKVAQDKQQAIEHLMDEKSDLSKVAILEEKPEIEFSQGIQNKVNIINYEENRVFIDVDTDKTGILILTDNYYPGWKVTIDNSENDVKILRVNYTFRGVIIPEGKHRVIFSFTM